MKKVLHILLTVSFLSASNYLFAQSITIYHAKTIASQYLSEGNNKRLKSTSKEEIKQNLAAVAVISEKEDTLYYILNDTINDGFVLVAADKRAWPILGYSYDGKCDTTNQPPAFTYWMNARKREIEHIKQYNILPDSKVSQQWEILEGTAPMLKSGGTSVAPLLKTTWNQGCYYNGLCPIDSQGPCGRVWAGCTATAMAQIMKYWNFPTTGNGSYSYTHSTYGIQSANFGATTYQWSQMPNKLTSANNHVATLLYHCGVAVNMNYSPGGSGAGEPSSELANYFNYSSKAKFLWKNDYSTAEWTNILKSELDLLRPIWYDGFNENSGHAFVCDGYQDDNYFHFNWGWGGYADGYFYLENLNPGGSSFNLDQGAVINILPTSLPDGYTGLFLSGNKIEMSANGDIDSLSIFSSANWTASSNQTWLTLSKSAGSSGVTSLILTVAENTTASVRSASLTISATGFASQTVTVSQSAKVAVTAGQLNNVLLGSLETTTNLTLTGTLDARDFKTMRDNMPLLTKIDLRDVTILAYEGTLGTAGTTNTLYPANTIPNYAFRNPETWESKENLTGFIFPSSTTAIGMIAFYGCTGLTSVLLPDLVTSVGSYAFNNCSGLSLTFIPASVNTIMNGAFNLCTGSIIVDENNLAFSSSDNVLFNKNKTTLINCSVSKRGAYSIPSTVSKIETDAFHNCSYLTSVSIPNSVVQIGSSAFISCTGFSSLFIPSSVTSIGGYAFFNCNGLTSIECQAFTPVDLSLSTFVFEGINKNTCALNVPYKSGANYQSANQWKDFTNIVEAPSGFLLGSNSVLIPATGGEVSLEIQANVTWQTTSDQPWLTVSPVSGTGNGTLIFTAGVNPLLINRTATVTLSASGITSQTLSVTQKASAKTVSNTAGSLATALSQEEKNNITRLILTGTIDARDFKTMRDNMPLLSEIDLSGATIVSYSGTQGTSGTSYMTYLANRIPNYAFVDPATWTGKYSLTSVICPLSATAIGDCSFVYCTGLTSFEIPPQVSSIGYYAFWGCNKISSVNLPASINFISPQAFYNCTGLTSIEAYRPTPVDLSSSSNVFQGVSKTACTLHVPFGSSGLYAKANQWQDFLNIAEMPGLTLSSSTVSVGGTANSSASITLQSNTPWTASSDQTWVTVNPESGSGNATLVFTAGANPLTSERTATITVSAQGIDSQTIELTQEAGTGNVVPETLSVTNLNLNSGETCYNATQNITLAGPGTMVDFQDGSTVTLIAGHSISFLPGFHAHNGSQVNAWITNNGTFCEGAAANPLVLPGATSSPGFLAAQPDTQASKGKGVKVYPNPNNGRFTIETTSLENSTSVFVFNILGTKIFQTTACSRKYEINLSGNDKGIYVVKVTYGNEQFIKKIIVK